MSRSIRLAAALAIVAGIAACTPSTGTASSAPTAGATTAATAPGATAGATAAADASTAIVVKDFQLDPSTITIASGTIAFEVTNEGPTVHNVKIRDAAGTSLFGSRDLREGEAETVVHEIAPGTYTLFCSLPGHESLGIKGTLTVTAP